MCVWEGGGAGQGNIPFSLSVMARGWPSVQAGGWGLLAQGEGGPEEREGGQASFSAELSVKVGDSTLYAFLPIKKDCP